ncbi:hypothetical protein G9A89_010613 [Geosiphon pyriformis]|nr:hypothetical protein G9A89_010613 [Geosiphon pyriformis]
MSSKVELVENLIASKEVEFHPYVKFSNILYTTPGIFGPEWRAEWMSRRITVQLLSFNHIFEKNEDTVALFVKEIKILAKLKPHPNILKFFGLTEDPARKAYFVILESTVKGQWLPEFLKAEKTLTWIEKVELASQIAEGIKHLHDQGIAHTELNSPRILVENRQIKITGLGLSAAMNDSVVTKTLFDGSPLYMDPGFLQDLNYKRTKKSDIYSLGMIFWEISSHRRPFVEDPPRGILQLTSSIISGEREDPVFGTPEQYAKLYQRCWDNDEKNRPNIELVVETLTKMKKDLEEQKNTAKEEPFEIIDAINEKETEEVDNQNTMNDEGTFDFVEVIDDKDKSENFLNDDNQYSETVRGSVYSQFSATSHHDTTSDATPKKKEKEKSLNTKNRLLPKWVHQFFICH